MTAATNLEVWADQLIHAAETGTPIEPLTATHPKLDLDTAYAIQRRLRAAAPLVVGWKLGLTSHAKQAQMGVEAQTYGFLSASHALDLCQPLTTTQLIHPRCEPEIAFFMGSDVAGPHVTATDVMAATAGVAPAIEVIDSRFAGFRMTLADGIADNSSAARFVCGAPTAPDGIDLRLVGVVLEHNGHVIATASGAAALGHPAAAVAWLVRSLSAHGEGLGAGQVVLSGALTAAVPVRPGDVITASIDRLGTVELGVQ